MGALALSRAKRSRKDDQDDVDGIHETDIGIANGLWVFRQPFFKVYLL